MQCVVVAAFQLLSPFQGGYDIFDPSSQFCSGSWVFRPNNFIQKSKNPRQSRMANLRPSPGFSPIELPPRKPKQRRFAWNIAWRFICAIFCAILLGLQLFIFERKGDLTTSERRGFNSITVLISALLSLTLGSLLSLLGSMLRWPHQIPSQGALER